VGLKQSLYDVITVFFVRPENVVSYQHFGSLSGHGDAEIEILESL